MRNAEPAPAKLNLALHVRGKRLDGRHSLETLFAFCIDGDRLEAEPKSLTRRRIERTDLIGRHEVHHLRRQIPYAIPLAMIQNHREESRIVGCRRYESGAAGEVLPRSVDVMSLSACTIRRFR